MSVHDEMVGDPATLGPAARDLADAARRAGHTEALIVALRAQAWFERLQLRNARALELLDEAAGLARRAGLDERLGEVLVSRAAVNLELGRTRVALNDVDRAGPLLADAATPELELKRGVLLSQIGRLEAAHAVYRAVLAHPAATVDVRARAANNLALGSAVMGRVPDALANIELACELAARVGPALAALVAQNRGLVLTQCGRLAEGLRQLDTAVEALAAVGLPLGEAYAESAEVLAALRALPEARELAARAVAELAEHDVPLMAAEARLKLAEIALLMGDAAAAREEAEAAVALFRGQRRTGWVAMSTVVITESRRRAGTLTSADADRAGRAADALARLGLVAAAVGADLAAGRAALEVGRTAMAARRFAAAARRSEGAPVLVRLQGRLAAALAAGAAGDDAAMLRQCRAGLRELAAHRGALASTELRALAAAHGVELGLLGMGSLLRSGSPSRVLDWAERTRAAAYLATSAPEPQAVEEEGVELAAVRAELAAARGRTGEDVTELLARQTDLEQRLRRATWHREGSGAEKGTTVRAGALADLLDGEALVSYSRYRDEVVAVVLDRGRRRLAHLGDWGRVRFEADALQFALRRLVRPGLPAAMDSAWTSARHALARLRELLVAPLGVGADTPLVVVPARGTHRLPWSALHSAPVSAAPSATLWAGTRERPVEHGGRALVVAGPGLDGAEHEVAVVAGCHPGVDVLVPPESTAQAVVDAIGRCDLVHFACHGLLRADNPTFSALELTGGQLTVHELDLRAVAPRRVVLASCDSAADVSYAGNELLGFVSALLARGTAGVVASVVVVPDAEAVPLMRSLHGRLAAGERMASALFEARAAQGTDDPRDFVNWCAFTAYGAG
ncbi:CHAT domain-containing protein [Pseudonocardia humida]|uniref:CHAT domain-containing protein n=1 Tax=Pseudonocardia humida TaxID=2800819 RepID=A0ABT1A8D1_9PSEU|nr:CHAT domain-containing protein [Pseudonocardia humida]MCO1659289.1 CHAT domain-containing protein [Pseudonocardia humida]